MNTRQGVHPTLLALLLATGLIGCATGLLTVPNRGLLYGPYHPQYHRQP
ncbi:MAG: hypothetical protein ACREU9_11835 [Gammaproteobacteria bacterium]